MTELDWLRATLKQCERISMIEGNDLETEALEALADIRVLIRVTLNNPPPAFVEQVPA